MDGIAFALVLNLHQPHGNLDNLLSNDPWAASEILNALDRIPRSLWSYPDKGRGATRARATSRALVSDRCSSRTAARQ